MTRRSRDGRFRQETEQEEHDAARRRFAEGTLAALNAHLARSAPRLSRSTSPLQTDPLPYQPGPSAEDVARARRRLAEQDRIWPEGLAE